MSVSTFNANMSRCIDLVSWPTAKWRSDYTGHVSYWGDDTSENNQGVFFIWFDLSAIQSALNGRKVTNIRVKIARQAGTGNANTLNVPVYMQTLNRTTYGVNRTTTLPNGQAVDPQNAQPYFSYSGGSLATVPLTYNASTDDYDWSTNITGTTAENIGNGFKNGTTTGFAMYWPYQDNAHYCKLRGYDHANIPQIEFTHEAINTAPYWPEGASVSVTPNGTIPENTSSLQVSWTAAQDAQSDPLVYKIYRNGTMLDDDWASTTYTDNIGTGNGGQTYQYTIYASDGSLWAATAISSAVVTKNLLTPASLSHSGNIGYSTATLSMSRGTPSNTNSDPDFTYNLECAEIPVYNPTVDLSSVGSVLTIWKSGGYPSGPYIKFSELAAYVDDNAYQGTLNFTLETTNDYGSTLSDTEAVTVDIRTTPTGLGNVQYSGGYTHKSVLYYLPDQRAITVTWDAATDPLGGAITYDVYYKLNAASTWTLARSNLATNTTTISPPSAATQQTYNVKIVAKTSYGTSSESSGANLLIDKYLRPLIILESKSRASTSVDISLTYEFRSSFAAAIDLTTSTYTKLLGGTVNLTLSDLYPDFTYSESGVFLNTSSYTMVITIQDTMGAVLSASAVTLNIPISAYIPMFSIREKGVGINSINDGTGNYKATLAGKINSVPDADGNVGFFKNGVELGTDIVMNAASHTVTYGTLAAGGYTSLDDIGTDIMGITEATGTNALQVSIGFTSITQFNQVLIYAKYAGGASHNVAIELYNKDTTSYDILGYMTNSSVYQWFSFPIFYPSAYINSGAVTLRFRHIDTGINTHALSLDYVVLKQGSGGGLGVTEHGALAGLSHDDHTQYHTDTRGDARYPLKSLITAASDFFVGDGLASVVKKTLAEVKTLLFGNQYFTFAGPTQARTFTFPDEAATIVGFSQGTFQPSVRGSSTAGTFTYTTRLGSYIKIGNFFWFTIRIKIASVSGSPAGNLEIYNFPVTPADECDNVYQVFGGGISWGTSKTQLMAYWQKNTAYMTLYGLQNDATWLVVPVGNFIATDDIIITGACKTT